MLDYSCKVVIFFWSSQMYFTSLAIVSMPVFSSGCSFFLLTDDDAYQRHLKTDHFLKYK